MNRYQGMGMKHMATRLRHYLIVVIVAGLLFLPNLGGHSLWDVDESHNAQCAREMLEAEDWCVPTFNFALRSDKPVLLYWVMRLAYLSFGVSEWSARIGSALCGIASALTTYELGRRMFDARTGLLAAIILASSVMFCVSAHAATPDALLILFTVLTFTIFWCNYQRGGKSWLWIIGITTGLAVLTKGPVGVLLPTAAIGLFLIWERRLRDLIDARLLGGLLLLALVTLPWYILVGFETKWEFWRGFFGKHNFARFQQPFEGHRGPFFYHPLVMLLGFAPWSLVIGFALWFSSGKRMREDGAAIAPATHTLTSTPHQAYRLLWCWLGVWVLFFSIAATKLPNYVLRAYPVLALFTARFLRRWSTGNVVLGIGWQRAALAAVALLGVLISGGLLVISGAVPVPGLENRTMPDLLPLAGVGLIPVVAALWLRSLLNGQFEKVVWGTAFAAVVVVGVLAAAAPAIVDRHKVPRALAAELASHRVDRDIQIGCVGPYQPGIVFYTDHHVRWIGEAEAIDLLRSPRQTFLIVPASLWDGIRSELHVPARIIARRRDFASGREMLLITNREVKTPEQSQTALQWPTDPHH